MEAPLVIVPHSNKDAYLDRYAQPDKGHTDRSDAWSPASYWDIDTGFAALQMLLTVVDAGLGACFFGLPAERVGAFPADVRPPAGIPPDGVSLRRHNHPPPPEPARRRPSAADVPHNQWDQPYAPG